MINEVAVQSQLADDRIHLAKRERCLALQSVTDEPIRIRRESRVQRSSTRIVGESSAVLARQRRQAEDAPDRRLTVALIHLPGERSDVRTDLGAASQRLRG